MRKLAWIPLLLLALAAPGPLLAATSDGPDAGGYEWYDTDDGCDVAAPPFGAGVVAYVAVTEPEGPIALGFDFPFFGTIATEAYVSPNGFISFTPVVGPHSPQEMPDPAVPSNLIAGHWSDVVSADMRVESTPDFFHVQWNQVIDPPGGRWLTDLTLFPDGTWHLRWVTPSLLDPVAVGHEKVGGTAGRSVWWNGVGESGFRGPGEVRSLCITYSAPLDCARAIPVPCNGFPVDVTLPPMSESEGTFYPCAPRIYPGGEQLFRVDVPEPSSLIFTTSRPTLVDLMAIDNPPCTVTSCTIWDDETIRMPFVLPGTEYFVVESQAGDGGERLQVLVGCQPLYTDVMCGEVTAGDTSTGPSAFATHDCAGVPTDGPESFYRVNMPFADSLTATIESGDPNLWVAIYRESDFERESPTCLTAGRGGAALPLAATGSYVIVVDGEAGALGPHELLVTCGAVPDCSALPDISCRETVTGDTTLGTNVLVGYSCISDALTGSELIYRFINPVEQTIRLRLTASQPGQQVLMLRTCSGAECMMGNQPVASCPLVPPGEYFIVVDGPRGFEGAFELEVGCSRILPGVDLQVSGVDSRGLPTSCASTDIAGVVDVTIANRGIMDAVAPFDVLVWEDADPGNDVFEPAIDLMLGQTTVSATLETGRSRVVPVDVAGSLRFRDNRLHAAVDAGNVVVEVSETNNVHDTGLDCEYRSPFGEFQARVEWEWRRSTIAPLSVQVDTTPLVGDVDGNGIPDVVFVTGEDPAGFGEGLVRVVSGLDGSEIWTATGPQSTVWQSSNLAIADLDGDGRLEVVGHSYLLSDAQPGHQLVCFDDDGTVLWRSEPFLNHPPVFRGGGGPAIADLNCDGRPEIVYGKNVFNGADGTYYWSPELGGTWGINEDGRLLDGPLSVAVDVDLDGELEVVAGPTCYELDPVGRDPDLDVPWGRILWQNESLPDGFVAVGQFDGDDTPEIVLTAAGTVYLLEGETGEVIWSRWIPLGGGGCFPDDISGGPPTVADFDGDCQPEVGVAGADWYVVLETDGTIKWRTPIVDCSSHRTASSVFDFDGDGAAEVAFMDEERLHVYRGDDGDEVTSLPTESHTWQEMITIADVDADGNAEIIVPLNSQMTLGPRGIQVIGDVDSNWVNTRRIWNQHAYHIDNVLDDGSIPGPAVGCEEPSWLGHATYRDQLGDKVFTAPDLTMALVSSEVVEIGDCAQEARLSLLVGNGGGIASPSDVGIWVYDGDPDIDGRPIWTSFIGALQPGEGLSIVLPVPLAREGSIELHAIIDGPLLGRGFVNECREDNNGCVTTVVSAGFPDTPPAAVGPALRATGHESPFADPIVGYFNWFLDEGLPRPATDHYHLLRSTMPQLLLPIGGTDPWVPLTWTDSSPRTPRGNLPFVYFLKVFAADRCEQVEENAPPGP